MIKEKWNSAKRFVSDHKTEIIMGTITIVTSIGLVVLGKKLKDRDDTVSFMTTYGEDLDKPEFTIGKIHEFWQDPGSTQRTMIVNDIEVGDLGRFGEQLLKINKVTIETPVDAIIGLNPEKDK